MNKDLFLLKIFNNNDVFNENKNITAAFIQSIIKLHENSKFNITYNILRTYMKNKYNIKISKEKFDIIYKELMKTFKIKEHKNTHYMLEDLYFELKKLFPILKDVNLYQQNKAKMLNK